MESAISNRGQYRYPIVWRALMPLSRPVAYMTRLCAVVGERLSKNLSS